MRRRTAPSRIQLRLQLEPETAKPPPMPGSRALLQAVADLLLAALGDDEADAERRKGGDEPEDHA
jgi:hypothetical protein